MAAYLREEPDALGALVRVGAGGTRQLVSLPRSPTTSDNQLTFRYDCSPLQP